jgi:hypothetical protein
VTRTALPSSDDLLPEDSLFVELPPPLLFLGDALKAARAVRVAEEMPMAAAEVVLDLKEDFVGVSFTADLCEVEEEIILVSLLLLLLPWSVFVKGVFLLDECFVGVWGEEDSIVAAVGGFLTTDIRVSKALLP